MNFVPYLGIFRNPTDCDLPLPSPEDPTVAESLSGVFLEDASEVPVRRFQPNAGYWDTIRTARQGAAMDLESDLKAFLTTGFPVRAQYAGSLGNVNHTYYQAPADQTAKFPLGTRYQRGGVLRIISIGMKLSATVSNQLIELYRESETTPLKSVTIPQINAGAQTQTTLAEPWVIPSDGQRYEIRAVLPDGVRVADNTMHCGCGGTMSALSNILTNCCSGKAHGFMTTVYSQCSYDPLMEQLAQNDQVLLVLGYMLAYQTGYRLCSTPPLGQIERATVLSESDLADAAKTCRQEYLNRLNWLKKEVSKLNLDTSNTCFQASRPFGWGRSAFA